MFQTVQVDLSGQDPPCPCWVGAVQLLYPVTHKCILDQLRGGS